LDYCPLTKGGGGRGEKTGVWVSERKGERPKE